MPSKRLCPRCSKSFDFGVNLSQSLNRKPRKHRTTWPCRFISARLKSKPAKSYKAEPQYCRGYQGTKEPGPLNDGAYCLADADMEVPLAEKYARSAIESFTSKSASWGPDTDSRDQRSDQAQMIAAWDTLAWILYKENHLDEAEGYARASWRNTLRGEAGLHLGLIEEKLGHSPEALAMYEIALSELTPAQRDTKGARAGSRCRDPP